MIADPQGAPLGLAQVRRSLPDPADPTPRQFFWDEYLARDAVKALDFYKRLAGYESTISESRLGVDYHLLRKTRARAGLFQLPASATGVEPNWLPYVLVDDPAGLAARVGGLGGSDSAAGRARAAEWFARRHRRSGRRAARAAEVSVLSETIMTANFVSRLFILGLVLAAALAASSCDNSAGFGMEPEYGSRWGGGSAGPGVFVGGPSR